MRTIDDLHQYQIKAIKWVLNHPYCAIFLDMGLGKTVIVQTVILRLLQMVEVRRVLVIAPKHVALHVWASEALDWAHTADLRFSVAVGTASERLDALERDDAEVYVINRENVEWLVHQFPTAGSARGKRLKHKPEGVWKWDMVVLDESSSFKNPSAKRFKALRKVLGHVTRMVQMTGSPAPNGLVDLWAPTYLLDQGKRLERSFTTFRDKYYHFNRYSYEMKLLPNSQKVIEHRLSDICLSMKAKDYLELPKTISNDIACDMPDDAQEMYEELQKEFMLELEALDAPLTVMSAAALTNKLLQLSNGFLYNEGETLCVHNAKLDALESIVAEQAGKPLLVAYNYRYDSDMIKARFKKAERLVWDKDQQKRWAEGKIPMLLVHPASAGHGLSLQHGGNTICWYGLNWSLELYEQTNARLGPTRQAQSGYNRPFRKFHLISSPMDQVVLSVVQGKEKLQDAFVKSLKK